jgi:hypothetical protein
MTQKTTPATPNASEALEDGRSAATDVRRKVTFTAEPQARISNLAMTRKRKNVNTTAIVPSSNRVTLRERTNPVVPANALRHRRRILARRAASIGGAVANALGMAINATVISNPLVSPEHATTAR